MTALRAASVLALATAAVVGVALCAGASETNPTSSVAGHQVLYTFGAVGGTIGGTKEKLSQIQHERPTPISGIRGTVTQFVATNSDTFALTSAGTVWAWGAGSRGQLGNGSTRDFVSTAVKVSFPHGVQITSLASPMPGSGALVIDSHDQAWGWGANTANDLCLPGGGVLLRPRKIPLPNVSLASGAGGHSLIDSGGQLYACGDGRAGQLGNGGTGISLTPTKVVGLPQGKIRALVSSEGSSGALMDDGTYYDWGLNSSGQLGDGSTSNSTVPVRVPLHVGVAQVFQGGSKPSNGQTLAILVDGSMWAWGDGKKGQLGDGQTQNALNPIRVTLPHGARPAHVATGGDSSYAIDTSGRLWAWGSNRSGQLGTGGRDANQLTPILVGILLGHISSTATNVAGLSR